MLDRKATKKATNADIDQTMQTYTDKRIRLIGSCLKPVDSPTGRVLPENSLPNFATSTKPRFLPNSFIFIRKRRRTLSSHPLLPD